MKLGSFIYITAGKSTRWTQKIRWWYQSNTPETKCI